LALVIGELELVLNTTPGGSPERIKIFYGPIETHQTHGLGKYGISQRGGVNKF